MSQISFTSKLYTVNGWTILKLPQEASSQLPSRGQVMVKGTINKTELLAPLEPDGNGNHWLHIDKKLQAATGLVDGDTAQLVIEATKDWPEPEIPADVKTGIVTHPEVREQWGRVTPMARWEWLRWIGSTSNPETRKKRIVVSRSKLSRGERRPCCFNRSMCCVPEVSKNGALLDPIQA